MDVPIVDAAKYLAAAHLNFALEFVFDDHDQVIFNLRATYWRNDRRADRMYLVADVSLDDALVRLAEAVDDERDVRLDWKARLATIGDLGAFQRSRLMPLPRNAAVEAAEARSATFRHTTTKTPSDGA